MIRHSARQSRAGITLIEILISIMILGIGVISLATLFPIGMVRLRNAQRYTRSTFLFESAAADLGARDLLNSLTFQFSPSYRDTSSVTGYYNPWVQDTPYTPTGHTTSTLGGVGNLGGAYRGFGGNGSLNNNRGYIPGEGLPVAYDPLFRDQAVYPNFLYPEDVTAPEARFASGIGLLRPDPNSLGNSSLASAHGLQRVTNMTPKILGINFKTIIEQTFVSPEDLVLQDSTGKYPDPANPGSILTAPSTIVPDLTMGTTAAVVPSPTNDWRYTWFFTGRQTDAQSGAAFDGDIVICENRQFGIDTVTTPYGTAQVPSGETVVEAIWGYSTTLDTPPPATIGYGSRSAMRTVVIRWLASQPDPDVRVGGWIADVTYERDQAVANVRFSNLYPGQRCHWYQVTKKTDVVDDSTFTSPNSPPYRKRTLWVSTPLKARTLLDLNTGGPVTPEAALIMPSVVNVVPRTVYTR